MKFSKQSISKSFKDLSLDLCKYDVILKFSTYDVLDGTELLVDNIYINENDKPLKIIMKDPNESYDITNFENVVFVHKGNPIKDDISEDFDEPQKENPDRYYYEMKVKGIKLFPIRIEKERYFQYKNRFNLNVQSIYDDAIIIKLGRIGLLSEIKEDALVLTWGKTPKDLDIRLKCPNDEIVGVKQTSDSIEVENNYYARVSVDATISEGPETIVINHWVDFDSKYKIGGNFKCWVNWFKD